MPNSIKYSVSAQSLALKKGNFWIGTGDVGKGPTSTTDYWNGITPPSGGYTIYLNKASQGPSIYVAANDSELISLTNSIAGASYTTVNECLVYFAGQTDKMVVNREYEPIVTDGLVLNLDAGFTPSYPKSGTTWYDLSENTFNANLVNGPIFVTTNGGGIQGDGIDDEIVISGATTFQPTDSFSIFAMLNWSSITNPGLDGNSTVFGRNPGGVLGNYGIGINPTNLQLGMRTFSNQFLNRNIPYTFGTTTYVGWTYTPGQGKFYQNGNLVGTTNNTNVTLSTVTTDSWRVWAPRVVVGGNGRRSSGVLYVASVYNRALSETEVLQNWNALKGRFGL